MKKYLLPLLLALAPFHAQAIPITSSAGVFDVTTTNVAGTAAVLSTTAWWGSKSLAEEFAGLANNDLGMPNGWGLGGPLFAYKNQGDDSYYAVYVALGFVTTFKVDEAEVATYAVSRYIGSTAVPEPTSIALLGVGLLALGWRRHFARR